MSKRPRSSLESCILFGIRTAVAIALFSIIGCGASHSPIGQDIMWVDDDQYHVPQPPKMRSPNYGWDFSHRTFIYPVDRLTDLPRYFGSNEAQNINALGEVPDSSWYTNRHARKQMTSEELVMGPNTGICPDCEGSWTIIKSKTQGVTPGFNIRDQKGNVYVIKFDPIDHPEMATAAEVISTLFFYAAGYNTPENYIVHFDPNNLVIGEGAKITDDKGKKRQMNEADLKEILARVSHRPDGKIRALASKYLDGKPIGPFSYRSRRKDDPNDIYMHRDRRELRGLKVIASFLNHVDAKGPNTLDMYITEGEKSYVKHYLIDFGATLGSGSTHTHNAATGHEYAFDTYWLAKSFVTLGVLGKPWDRSRTMEHPAIGFFEAETFHPGKWKQSYPNPAFMEMTDRDAYWGARIVMEFTPEEIRKIVEQVQYSDPEVERYIADTLIKRREKIGRYWYSKVNPLDRFRFVDKSVLSFDDMAVVAGLEKTEDAKYRWKLDYIGKEKGTLADYAEITSTRIVFPPNIVEEMKKAILWSGQPDDPSNRVFSVSIETKRADQSKWCKNVYINVYYSPEGKFKVIGVERE